MQQTRRQQHRFYRIAVLRFQIAPQRFFDILPVQLFLTTVVIVNMPGFNVVDIMHDNVVRLCFQYRVVDDDAVILFGQLYKITVDNAVERVLVAPEDLRASYLFQPLKQLLCQFLPPPLSKIHQYHAGVKIAAVFQTDTVTAAVFPIITRCRQYLPLQI